MHSSIFLAVGFAVVAIAAPAVSEFTDGQPQAVTSTTYTNAFTSFLTETNSLGVVTGKPSVVTSQPAVVTSQPAVVTSQPAVVTSIPAVVTSPAGPIVSPHISSGLTSLAGANATITTATLSTTVVASTTASSVAAAGATSAAATTPAKAAGVMVQPAVGLGLVGAIFAALL